METAILGSCNHFGRRATRVAYELRDPREDPPARDHAGARDDDHRSVRIVETRRFAPALNAEQVLEVERIIAVRELVERLLVEERTERAVGEPGGL